MHEIQASSVSVPAGLSGGAIAGIVIGSVVGVALLAAVALMLARHTDFGGRRGGRSLV